MHKEMHHKSTRKKKVELHTVQHYNTLCEYKKCAAYFINEFQRRVHNNLMAARFTIPASLCHPDLSWLFHISLV